MLAIAIIIFIAARLALQSNLSFGAKCLYLSGLLLFFFIGAFFFYLVFYTNISANFTPIGFSLYGGLIIIVIYQIAVAYLAGVNTWSWLDKLAPGLWAYVVIGKLGCFFNSCCFGTPTLMPWGIYYSNNTQAYKFYISQFSQHAKYLALTVAPARIHPVQIYESTGAFILLIMSIWLIRKKIIPGVVFLLTFALYSFTRLGTYYFRVPPTEAQLNYLLPYIYSFAAFFCLALCLFLIYKARKFNDRGVVNCF